MKVEVEGEKRRRRKSGRFIRIGFCLYNSLWATLKVTLYYESQILKGVDLVTTYNLMLFIFLVI